MGDWLLIQQWDCSVRCDSRKFWSFGCKLSLFHLRCRRKLGSWAHTKLWATVFSTFPERFVYTRINFEYFSIFWNCLNDEIMMIRSSPAHQGAILIRWRNLESLLSIYYNISKRLIEVTFWHGRSIRSRKPSRDQLRTNMETVFHYRPGLLTFFLEGM
jgi:hypothetical protein